MPKDVDIEVLKPLHKKGTKTIQPGTPNIKLPEGKDLDALVTAGAVKILKLTTGDKK
ncbi:MAG: hypothetical protein WA916_08965 [Arcobacter sp.]|uniref:hypothetical protein n=1 Tax=Arcobacter sp. TaxID=1872629 RepID=UPI003C77442E